MTRASEPGTTRFTRPAFMLGGLGISAPGEHALPASFRPKIHLA